MVITAVSKILKNRKDATYEKGPAKRITVHSQDTLPPWTPTSQENVWRCRRTSVTPHRGGRCNQTKAVVSKAIRVLFISFFVLLYFPVSYNEHVFAVLTISLKIAVLKHYTKSFALFALFAPRHLLRPQKQQFHQEYLEKRGVWQWILILCFDIES